MTSKMTATVMASILIAATAAMNCYGANVPVYSEDFEGGTDGQSVTAAPFNWTGDGADDADVTSTTQFGAGTLAFDGDTANTSGPVGFVHDVPSARPIDDNYTLSARAYLKEAHPDGGVTGTGTAQGAFGFVDSSGDYVGWYYNAGGSDQWQLRDFAVIPEALGAGVDVGVNEIIDLSVTFDVTTGTISGSMVHGGGTLNLTLSGTYSQAQLLDWDTVRFLSDYQNGAGAGIERGLHLDDILLMANVPEPGTLALLGIGALVLRMYRRRMVG